MSVQYSLLFVNNSPDLGDACVYQTDAGLNVPDAMSLAWFSKAAAPTTRIRFTWTVDYDFVWAEVGELKAGVIFDASQVWPANLSSTNQVDFTLQGGAYTFTNQTKGPEAGTLSILQSATIPAEQAAVGIGMSGGSTFAVQASPGTRLTFMPQPRYWITFGTYLQGEVLNVAQIIDPAEIVFPLNVYSMTAILNKDGSWTIQPTRQINAEFLQAQREDRGAGWGLRE